MLIIFRSCTWQQVHEGTRIVQPKVECACRCLRSLARQTAALASPCKIAVVDDNSPESDAVRIKDVLAENEIPTEFITLEKPGNSASMLACYELAKTHDGLVYLVEDDYLHAPDALVKMLEIYSVASEKMPGMDVAVHALDDADNYKPQFIDPCRIVHTKSHHWRTNTYTTWTVMVHSRVIKKFWSCFEGLTHYGESPDIHENTTVNRVWKSGAVTLFTPIPTLAFHLQFPENISPVANWKTLWEQNGPPH